MEITEKWLGEIGGWAAMKAARGLVAAGLVTVTDQSAEIVRGSAGTGRSRFSCGLRIRSKSDVDNLCTCPLARGRGQMCEHSLAVALLSIQSPAPAPQRSQPAPAPSTVSEKEVPAALSVFLPDFQSGGRAGDRWNVFLKAESGSKEKSRLAGWLAAQRLPAQSSPLSLGSEELGGFLEAIAEHPRVFVGRPPVGQHRQVQVVTEGAKPPMIASAEHESAMVSLRLADSKMQLAIQPRGDSARHWWFAGTSGTLFRTDTPTLVVEQLLRDLNTAKGLAVKRPLRWFALHADELGAACQLTLEGDVLAHFHVLPVPCEFELELDGSLQEARITLSATWGGHRWIASRGTSSSKEESDLFPIQDNGSDGSFYARNIESENTIFRRLEALSFTNEGTRWLLKGAGAVWDFLGSGRRHLASLGRVVETERWKAATRGILRVAPILHTEPAGNRGETAGAGTGQSRDWLTMEFSYQAPDGFKIGRSEILRMIRSGQKSVSGPSGKKYALDVGACEELEESFRDVPLELTATGAKIRPEHAFYFSPELREKAESIQDLQATEVVSIAEKITDLRDILRPYQMLGVTWLHRHAQSHAGAVLGDDMGLGKTIQTIAVIRALYSSETGAGETLPSLVLCPKSLLGNWAAEFAKFAPEIPVVVVSGSDRKNTLANIPVGCVIITSYPLIIRDLPAYLKLELRVAALDEASFIRNPDTEVAKAVRSLRAKFRIALTGTPVENGVRDLWSIFNFAVPGYLGSQTQFKERFEQPIAAGLGTPAGQDAANRLKRLVRPFFLRRTKKEVLKDLPEKIEQVLWCEMSQGQGEVYRRVLEEGRAEIRASQKRSGQNGARMTMFTVLLRLRQVCCDLRLTGVDPAGIAGMTEDELSGKWALLGERLEEIVASGGKALIFSQFVKFLRLGSKYLEALNIDYCYLDGGTQDRVGQVNEFQTNPTKSAFLISLKAGGYGLNLTAADHVILLDPWWNPAVEAQAIDRAHRIGQQRVVTASRIIMRGTVEERILKLQASKRGLVEATLDENSPLMAGLSDTDLEDLLM